jgi:hypothetical protein
MRGESGMGQRLAGGGGQKMHQGGGEVSLLSPFKIQIQKEMDIFKLLYSFRDLGLFI